MENTEQTTALFEHDEKMPTMPHWEVFHPELFGKCKGKFLSRNVK